MSQQIKKRLQEVDKIRADAFPKHTCPASRHAHIMAETLAEGKEYAMFSEEPEHCADTLLAVIGSLWQARMHVATLERQLEDARQSVLTDIQDACDHYWNLQKGPGDPRHFVLWLPGELKRRDELRAIVSERDAAMEASRAD